MGDNKPLDLILEHFDRFKAFEKAVLNIIPEYHKTIKEKKQTFHEKCYSPSFKSFKQNLDCFLDKIAKSNDGESMGITPQDSYKKRICLIYDLDKDKEDNEDNEADSKMIELIQNVSETRSDNLFIKADDLFKVKVVSIIDHVANSTDEYEKALKALFNPYFLQASPHFTSDNVATNFKNRYNQMAKEHAKANNMSTKRYGWAWGHRLVKKINGHKIEYGFHSDNRGWEDADRYFSAELIYKNIPIKSKKNNPLSQLLDSAKIGGISFGSLDGKKKTLGKVINNIPNILPISVSYNFNLPKKRGKPEISGDIYCKNIKSEKVDLRLGAGYSDSSLLNFNLK